DPLNEYKSEAFKLFNNMLEELRERVTSLLLRIDIRPDAPPPAPEGIGVLDMRHPDPAMAGADLLERDPRLDSVAPIGTASQRSLPEAVDPNDPATWARTPRNAPCPCGSGKKFKACHGRV
ncbi:MAG: preprotein translocase subunit SecA, partial [Pseudomonadota bacterium]